MKSLFWRHSTLLKATPNKFYGSRRPTDPVLVILRFIFISDSIPYNFKNCIIWFSNSLDIPLDMSLDSVEMIQVKAWCGTSSWQIPKRSTLHKVAVPCWTLQILLPMGETFTELMYYCTVTFFPAYFVAVGTVLKVHKFVHTIMTRLVYHSSLLQFDHASVFRNFRGSIFFMWMDPVCFSFITRVWLDQGPTNTYQVPWPVPFPGTLAPFLPSKKTPCHPLQLHHISSLMLQLFLNVTPLLTRECWNSIYGPKILISVIIFESSTGKKSRRLHFITIKKYLPPFFLWKKSSPSFYFHKTLTKVRYDGFNVRY